jgi:hypothetical protein
MRPGRWSSVLLALAAAGSLGGSCGGGSGGGGRSVRSVQSLDVRCAAQPSFFPPGFAFVPGQRDLVWSADFTPPTLLPFAVDTNPPEIAPGLSPFLIPFDSDGDGFDEFLLAPVPDDLEIPTPGLGLLTASSYEEVIFFDPGMGGLIEFEVSVPAGVGFVKSHNPFLPDPGSSAPRTALSTFACVRPAPGAVDSRGDAVAVSVPAAGFCDGTFPSYLASFTSGAALAGGRLFVSVSNLGGDAGTPEPQYLPGAVLVYDIDLGSAPPTVSPHPGVPVILTTDFNPTHVTGYSAGGRDFVLVTNSGSIGIEADDPSTREIEGAGIALTDASIDVIDADSLVLVATVPLGRAGLSFDRLAIDASGRVAATGSAVARHLLAVDLGPLPGLPAAPVAPLVLDGSSGPDAVIFDAAAPFQIPARVGGAPASSCPGFTVGTAWDAAGRLYATDFCDGTLSVLEVALSPSPPTPVPPARFSFGELLNVVEPLRSDTLGELRQLGTLEVRPGGPGVDAEVFFLVGEPGHLCGITVESP